MTPPALPTTMKLTIIFDWDEIRTRRYFLERDLDTDHSRRDYVAGIHRKTLENDHQPSIASNWFSITEKWRNLAQARTTAFRTLASHLWLAKSKTLPGFSAGPPIKTRSCLFGVSVCSVSLAVWSSWQIPHKCSGPTKTWTAVTGVSRKW